MTESKKLNDYLKPDDGIAKKASFGVSTYFFIGMSPKAPGTVASLATIPLVLLLLLIGGVHGLIIGTLIISVIGFISVTTTLSFLEGIKDPAFIVIDEVIGQSITFILPLIIFPSYTWLPLLYLSGFILFRVFDIFKPWHIGWADEFLDGATGVVLDDIIAGLYSTVILTAIMFVYFLIMRFGSSAA